MLSSVNLNVINDENLILGDQFSQAISCLNFDVHILIYKRFE